MILRPEIKTTKVESRLTDIICKVCKLGRIYEQISELKYERKKTIVTTEVLVWSETEYNCNVCGVTYKFLPAQELEPENSSDETIQIRPNLWTARKSSSIFSKTR